MLLSHYTGLFVENDVDDDGDVDVAVLNRRRAPTITHCWSDGTQTARRRFSRKRPIPSIKFRMLEIPLTRKIPRYVLHGFRVTQSSISPRNIVRQFFLSSFFPFLNKSEWHGRDDFWRIKRAQTRCDNLKQNGVESSVRVAFPSWQFNSEFYILFLIEMEILGLYIIWVEFSETE